MYLFTFLSKDYLAPYLCKYMASLKCNYSYSDNRVCRGIPLCISQIINEAEQCFMDTEQSDRIFCEVPGSCPFLKLGYLSFSYWFGVLYTSSGSDGKESACNAGDLGLIPGLGRSPGGGHGNPLQYSCLEKPHGQKGLVGCSPWGCKELDTTEQLSARMRARAHTHTHPSISPSLIVSLASIFHFEHAFSLLIYFGEWKFLILTWYHQYFYKVSHVWAKLETVENHCSSCLLGGGKLHCPKQQGLFRLKCPQKGLNYIISNVPFPVPISILLTVPCQECQTNLLNIYALLQHHANST